MADKCHDYRKGHWGHDAIVTQVSDGGQAVRVAGWGPGITEGDFLMLKGPSSYRVDAIRYESDPPDMWFATCTYAPGVFGVDAKTHKIIRLDERENPMSIRSAIEDVAKFHDAANITECATTPALTRRVLRWRLLKEEIDELEAAIMNNDLPEVADAYADIVYIVLGSALVHIGKERFIKVWDEVQRSNMAKCTNGKIVMREDGKVLKPEGWTPPDIAAILEGDND